MTGPYHYKRAEEILAEVEAADAVPDGQGRSWPSGLRLMPFSR
jgi:hypothetical protein